MKDIPGLDEALNIKLMQILSGNYRCVYICLFIIDVNLKVVLSLPGRAIFSPYLSDTVETESFLALLNDSLFTFDYLLVRFLPLVGLV